MRYHYKVKCGSLISFNYHIKVFYLPTDAQLNCVLKTILKFTLKLTLFVCFHGRPRQATGVLQPAGLLYRPLWTFQLWPQDAPAPTDAFLTLAAEVGTYGRE
jgi:hypothetical protein